MPNGVDPEEVEKRAPSRRLPGLSISYTGTLYGGRSLDSVMEAFGKFLAIHPEARAAGSRLRVAGHMDPPHAGQFLEQIRSRGLEDVVEPLGSIPRERALSLARASSISLVLAQAQELQVPGKIYELAALGCSMLVVCERESASADEAERLGVPWCEPDDIEGLVGILERAWAERAWPRARPDARISYESIALSMEHLLGGLTRVRVKGACPRSRGA